MSGGGGGLSKLATGLVIIFAVSLLALFAQLFYALWRRRIFRRQTDTAGGVGDEVSHNPSSESAFSSIASSKELLYFFCIRPQFRLDRNSLTASSGANSNQQPGVEVIDVDLLTIQGTFGPPRFLFTIKEEEREELESPAKISLYPAAEKKVNDKSGDENRGGVSLEKYFQSEEESVVADTDDRGGRGVDNGTAFWTPCGSPAYFTPSASPVHEVVNDRSPDRSLATAVAL